MEEASPARLYCLLVGAVLVIAGIIGFFYEASFASGDSIRSEDVFGVLSVNGWHNVVHIALGVLLSTDLRWVNGVKNLLAGLVNGVAAALFLTLGTVAWQPALLIAAGSAARGAALFVGVVYIALCVLGFIATSDNGIGFIAENDTLIKLVPVNDEDNVLHLILGVTGVIAAYASRPVSRTAPAT